MQPLTWARVVYERAAYLARQQLDAPQRQRLERIIQVIKTGPEDGLVVGTASDGAVLRQMTGADLHVVYTVSFWAVGRVLIIVTIEIRDWEPLDAGDTLGCPRRRGQP